VLNIIIPVGGKGRRFYDAGYKKYKPFLEVGDKTMIECVWDNVKLPEARLILSVRPQDRDQFQELFPAASIIVDDKQMGAAGGVLACKNLLGDDPCIVANSDQIVDASIEEFVDTEADGRIMTFHSDHPKWSYAKVCEDEVTYVAEKEVISNNATVGIYYYKKGNEMIKAIEKMIEDGFRYNGEFYLCPAYNYYPRHKKIDIYEIKESQMFGLGTPEDYEKNKVDAARVGKVSN
jgi:dTDP-glucose pyrophosphorylase